MSGRRPQVAVIGKGSPDEELGPVAEEVGRRLAQAGAVVVCGGRGGVMEAAARGASEAGGTVIGIVPGTETAEANPHCTHVVASAVGHGRNLAVVASGDAVIAIGGEWGTLSEIAFARMFGRPVVALRSWRVEPAVPIEGDDGIEVAEDPATAVASALATIRR
ncbi:MAG TPA: TIGR00725 family protein [Solirubrobacterales bacterium]|nr:TIGR00725 family protein [Solirubrobacterales bacterium]